MVLLMSGYASAQKQIHLQWTEGNSPGWKSCTAGAYCLTGYTLYELTAVPTQIALIPQASTTYSFPIPPIGYHSYSLVQDGIYPAGSPVQSSGNHGFMVYCQKVSGWRTCSVKKRW